MSHETIVDSVLHLYLGIDVSLLHHLILLVYDGVGGDGDGGCCQQSLVSNDDAADDGEDDDDNDYDRDNNPSNKPGCGERSDRLRAVVGSVIEDELVVEVVPKGIGHVVNDQVFGVDGSLAGSDGSCAFFSALGGSSVDHASSLRAAGCVERAVEGVGVVLRIIPSAEVGCEGQVWAEVASPVCEVPVHCESQQSVVVVNVLVGRERNEGRITQVVDGRRIVRNKAAVAAVTHHVERAGLADPAQDEVVEVTAVNREGCYCYHLKCGRGVEGENRYAHEIISAPYLS